VTMETESGVIEAPAVAAALRLSLSPHPELRSGVCLGVAAAELGSTAEHLLLPLLPPPPLAFLMDSPERVIMTFGSGTTDSASERSICTSEPRIARNGSSEIRLANRFRKLARSLKQQTIALCDGQRPRKRSVLLLRRLQGWR